MFTNNFINLQKAAFMNGTATLKRPNNSTMDVYVNDSDCTLRYAGLGYWLGVGRCQNIVASASTTSFNKNAGVGGIWFGNSPTPATKDDYTLGNVITSGLTITTPSNITQKNDVEGNYSFLSDFVVRNTTEADINIFEIGLFAAPVNGNYAFNILMEHTVLTEPITIPAGESKLVTYAIRFNQTMGVD
jgi:hypothetical protein